MSEESTYRKYTDDNLVVEAGSSARTEMMRRLKAALEAQERSAKTLGERLWWLNLWLLVFTVAIFGLTTVQVAIALRWIGR